MNRTLSQAFYDNFMGDSPDWYKQMVVAILLINPIVFAIHPFVAGWLLIVEFIFTLAMALKCYPLIPGGLIAIEAVAIGMVSTDLVYEEVRNNNDVILLLIFMVAGIYFMKQLLLFTFTKILLGIRSKILLAVLFNFTAAFLSAFLDALTVTAVIITIASGFYTVYHKVASGKHYDHDHDHDHANDGAVQSLHREDLERFRAFLRSLLMHGAVGTALGGVCTQVGEPQNLIIAARMNWDFLEFFQAMAIVSMPVLFAGLLTCALLEKMKWFGYGEDLPPAVKDILADYAQAQDAQSTSATRAALISQAVIGVILVLSLAFHLAAVGLVGLMVIILATTTAGVTDEHQIGKAFTEALPFTALLVVFFVIVGVIHQQHLFQGIIQGALAMDVRVQPAVFFMANGLLSAISDNVFVATVYINEVTAAFNEGLMTRAHFEKLAVAINTGTNLPSVATPNGQAAFLFLLTSAIAPLVRLSYGRMVWMALPYTLVMGGLGLVMVEFFL